MKRLALYIGLTAALVASCSTQEKDLQTHLQDDVVFYASFEQPVDEGTRVYANEDLLLRWTADDRISIFNKNTYNQQYRFAGETGDNAGGFDKVAGSEFATGNAISHVVSVYPYQSTTKISESESLTLTLPAEQHYAENSFGPGASTMVSVTADNFLQYKTVGGYLRLRLYGDGVSVSSITLKGNDGEKLAGKATVTMPLDGTPTVALAEDATDQISLTCDTPVALGATAEESKDFWLVVPPVTFSKGFTIIVSVKGGVFEKTTEKTVTIERNNLSKMSPIEVELSQARNVIYYTSVDEAVVTPNNPNAFGATILSNEYINGRGVITFDGDVTIIGNYAFSGCSSLTSINIPDSVMSIGSSAFSDCKSLTSINIPERVTSIGQYAFSGCSSLTSINIPDSVMSIGSSAFRDCSSLTSITIPESVTSIGMNAFSGCTSLTRITLPESVTSIANYAFMVCSSISSITIPNSVTSIGHYAFYRCTNLTNITIPENVTSIGTTVFAECSSLTSITVLSEIPPSGGSSMFNNTNNCPIYVPAESVEAYKSAQYWSDYADRIQAIPSSSVPVPQAVDMGLSVKWASFNLGASKPEGYGGYYAWGETLTKTEYTYENYRFYAGRANGDSGTILYSKYVTTDKYGSIDNKTQLELADDAANINLGGKWRIPTKDEWKELKNRCVWTYQTRNGINGYEVKSNSTGKSIFLPMTGSKDDRTITYRNEWAFYWSSSLYVNEPAYAYVLYMSADVEFYIDRDSRKGGNPIRPVSE